MPRLLEIQVAYEPPIRVIVEDSEESCFGRSTFARWALLRVSRAKPIGACFQTYLYRCRCGQLVSASAAVHSAIYGRFCSLICLEAGRKEHDVAAPRATRRIA